MSFSSSRFARPMLAALTATTVLGLATGCAIQSTATSGPVSTVVPAFSGKVHGGQQPIFGSVIGIYAGGNTGYGSGYSATPLTSGVVAPTNLVLTKVTTDKFGGFTLPTPIVCPSATTPIYLTATGGDPTGAASTSTNNTAIKEVVALGPCGNLTASSFVFVNEVTTVAAAFALGQFFGGFGSATDGIGASSTNQNGLINAFATAHNLVSSSTGVATPYTTAAPGTNYYLAQLDQQKLYTMANIIASCINQTTSTASNCSTLFTAAAPYYAPQSTTTTATLPVDTFQAAVYLSLNPSSNNSGSATSNSTANIATLFGLQSAFMPYGNALSAVTTDWTLAIQYTGTGINYLSSAAVDANGDLWFSNTNTTGGVVQLNGGTGTVGGTAGVTGGVIGFYSGNASGTANGTRQVAIDKEGNAWYGGYNANFLFRTTGGTGTTLSYATNTGALPYAIAIDGNDIVNVSTGTGSILTIAATATTGSPTSTPSIVSSSSAAGLAAVQGTSNPIVFAPTKGGANVYTYTSAVPPTGSTSITDTATHYGVAVDSNNKAWIANETTAGSLTTGAGATYTTTASGCLATPLFVAVDGGNNIWVSNTATTSTMENGATVSANTICEFNNAGALISSSVGYGPHSISIGRGIAVDLSGNVWVTSYGTGSSNVTEIVGAGVPTPAPLSLTLANGKVGTRP